MSQSGIVQLRLDIGRVRAEELCRQQEPLLEQLLAARAANRGALIVYGDSWLRYEGCWGRESSNMVLELTQLGFAVYERASFSTARMEQLAQEGALRRLDREFQRAKADGVTPKGIVLCGGGNDAVSDDRFYELLNDLNPGPRGLNDYKVRQRINEEIKGSYVTVLGAIDGFSRHYFNRRLPIYVHGYDYPVPDGSKACGLVGPWLGHAFRDKGYAAQPGQSAECRAIAKELIDRFNAMLSQLPQVPELSGMDIRHVTLTGTLTDPNYQNDWENELHPTEAGFGKITEVFVRNAAL